MAELLRDIDAGQAEAGLQLPERHARTWRRRRSRCCRARSVTRDRRPLCQLRRRPRLPVPVQLLHHHQRPGPQVALPHRRRRRGDRARQRRPGHHPLFRHRRQFRPQPQLGADPRPPDRAARAARASRSGCSCRSTRSATRSRASSRRRRGPAATRSSSGSRTSIPQSLHGRQEAAEQDLGIPRHAAGLAKRTR